MRTVQAVIDRVRAEYLDMPGLRLTAAQVERLCGIEQRISTLVLQSLVEASFLYLGADGAYARTEGLMPKRHTAKAGLAGPRDVPKAS